jgi:hypothetical protein
VAHPALTVLVPYALACAERRRLGGARSGRTERAIEYAQKVYAAASLASFVAFLADGK